MKVVVLGGAGDMGSAAVRDLVKFTDVTGVTIADINTAAAEKLAASLGGSRVSVAKLDAASPADLVRVIAGHDVAAGALGPFYRFERPIVEAVLEAGVDYVSICDDHDAAEAVLQLDRAARGKGRRVLTGLGWTPGLSNLLACKGCGELDEVESIRIYWAGSAGDSEGFAVILHTIHIFTGLVTSFRDGQAVAVKAGSEKEVVEFLLPLGKVSTFHVGHPEPVTLPRYLEGVREVTLKGGLAENYLNGLARLVAALRLTNTPRKKQRLGKVMKKLMPLFPVNKERCFSGIRVDLSGSRGARKVRLTYAAVDHMHRLTGIPLSIGTYMMGRGQIERTGVFGPEAPGAVDPDRFLQELARRDVVVERSESEITA